MEKTHILTFGKMTEAFCLTCQRGTIHTVTSDVWQDKEANQFVTVICSKCHQHGFIHLEDDDD